MVLRMVRIQPPIEVITIVSAGRNACDTTWPMKSHDRLIDEVRSYANPSGNQLSVSENSSRQNSAIQKYGKAEMMIRTGGRIASKMPPRRHAASIPTSVPRMKAMIVAVPTNPKLQGSASMTTFATEVGKNVSDTPRFPVNVLPRYSKYCWTMFWSE